MPHCAVMFFGGTSGTRGTAHIDAVIFVLPSFFAKGTGGTVLWSVPFVPPPFLKREQKYACIHAVVLPVPSVPRFWVMYEKMF